MEPKEILQGNRIVLQKPEVSFDYAQKMFAVANANRETVMPWLEWALPEITSSAEDDFLFASDADKAWKKGERFEYAIYDIKNKDFLGVIGVIRRGKERNQAIELGYWLKKDAQGYGYMQEAVKLVEDEFFSLGIQRITIRVDVENEKSNKFAIKAGYSFEGKLRKGHYNMCLHQFRDLNLYSKIKNN